MVCSLKEFQQDNQSWANIWSSKEARPEITEVYKDNNWPLSGSCNIHEQSSTTVLINKKDGGPK